MFFLVGIVAGLLSGLFGIGGGVVVVPALSSMMTMHVAVATSLAVMIMTSLSALYAHNKAKNIRWHLILPMIPGLIFSSLIGAAITRFLPITILHVFFSIFLILISWSLIFPQQKTFSHSKKISNLKLRIISVIVGMLSGILGVGGGALLAPIFLRSGLDLHEAAGTSVICGLTVGLTTTIGFVLVGLFENNLASIGSSYINFSAFFSVGIASVIAAPFGAKLSRLLPKKLSRKIFGIFLLLMSAEMLLTVR